MTEPKTNIELQSNEETFASIFLVVLGRFLRFFLVQVFHCLSIVSQIVDLCSLPLKAIDSAMGSTKECSASEYILDTMGEYEGDGDDLIEAPPFRLSWPVTVTVPTNVSLRRLQESVSKDSVDSTENNRPPTDTEGSSKRRRSMNEFAEKSKSFAKRVRTERAKLLATVAEQQPAVRSTSLDRSPKLKRRSLRFTNELAEKSKNSIAELIKTERTKLAEKGTSIVERIHLQERSTNIAERLQAEKAKLNERTTAIAEKLKVAKRHSFKVANRGRSFSENSKLEVLG